MSESQVYPRGCGATLYLRLSYHLAMGLSPRVRGNLGYAYGRTNSAGSIPAGAGQPIWWTDEMSESQVYPRGCGATWGIHAVYQQWMGLSPRVRGNRLP